MRFVGEGVYMYSKNLPQTSSNPFCHLAFEGNFVLGPWKEEWPITGEHRHSTLWGS